MVPIVSDCQVEITINLEFNVQYNSVTSSVTLPSPAISGRWDIGDLCSN